MKSTRSGTALIVAGMHRSGTSATTRILNLLGAALPGNLMAASSKFNPTGFWESNDVVAINDHLLADTDSHWDEMFDFDIGALAPVTLSKFHADVSDLLESDLADKNFFVIKDPRISRTLPLWLEALRRHQHAVKIIIPVRHPLEVAASLGNRDGFSIGKSVYLWLRYMLDSVRYSASDDYGIVIYDELIQDWRSSIERLRQELQIAWPIDVINATPAIAAFLDGGLRHHHLSNKNWVSEGQSPNPIADLATQLYDALLNRAPDLVMLANEIHKKLAAVESFSLPLLEDYRRQRQIDLKQQAELNSALVRVSSNVTDLEHLLDSERLVFKNLDAEFNNKCTQVLMIQDEISVLKQRIADLNAGNMLSDASKHEEKKDDVEIVIDFYDKNLRHYQSEVEKLTLQHEQLHTEVLRAEAQLELLKDLFRSQLGDESL